MRRGLPSVGMWILLLLTRHPSQTTLALVSQPLIFHNASALLPQDLAFYPHVLRQCPLPPLVQASSSRGTWHAPHTYTGTQHTHTHTNTIHLYSHATQSCYNAEKITLTGTFFKAQILTLYSHYWRPWGFLECCRRANCEANIKGKSCVLSLFHAAGTCQTFVYFIDSAHWLLCCSCHFSQETV